MAFAICESCDLCGLQASALVRLARECALALVSLRKLSRELLGFRIERRSERRHLRLERLSLALELALGTLAAECDFVEPGNTRG
jgi:hypothetical protein